MEFLDWVQVKVKTLIALNAFFVGFFIEINPYINQNNYFECFFCDPQQVLSLI